MVVRGRHILWAAGALVVGAFLFWLGAPYNIAASRAHLPGVSEFLHGYMKNAVRIRASGLEVPKQLDLDDPGLIRLGAGHYATGCATCHGAPGRARSPVAKAMQPAPPRLEDHDYSAKELYWLVRHGLKYTGMPAWAGEGRDDEPWALAAFLRRLPALTPEDYRDLAYGASPGPDAAAVSFGNRTGGLDLVEDCARCHGTDALGREGTAPKLAGQSEVYLRDVLHAYADGSRESGIMEPVAAALTDAQIDQLATRFAGMAGEWSGRPLPIGDPERGRTVARAGDEHEEVPSCVSCHGDGEERPARAGYPRIAGQDADWLYSWLLLWRDGALGEGPQSALMHASAQGLTDADIADLAAFYASAGSGISDR